MRSRTQWLIRGLDFAVLWAFIVPTLAGLVIFIATPVEFWQSRYGLMSVASLLTLAIVWVIGCLCYGIACFDRGFSMPADEG